MRLNRLVQALRELAGRPPLVSIAGLVALVVACGYVYLLLGIVARDTAHLVASASTVTPPASESETTPTPTATSTVTPSGPTATSTVTPTYTPISYTPTPAFLVYTVQRGDTLGGIARRYNTTVAAMMELNSLKSDLLSIGQELLIHGQRHVSSPEPTSTPTASPETATPTPTATAPSTWDPGVRFPAPAAKAPPSSCSSSRK